ncbi:murein biosynthesis integral membrane protein MurJ [Anaerotignum propionicum]|uniref:murein biosynthesis integral membrane protein MurJ n=1 Tax=Anaerotignum propionicum TaxID=28446 RepID=UPI0028978776|nr:lipid II flippase MurJ [Anaerotignum propionicum]
MFLIGWGMQIVIQIPTLYRIGYHYHLYISWDDMMNKVIKLVLPAMLSTWVQPINQIVCTKFASDLYEGGGVSALNYANNIYIVIVGVLVSSVANVIFPDLSRLSARKNELDFIEMVNSTIKSLSFILIPMMVGLFIMCRPIVQLIYGSNIMVTDITSITLRYFSVGMFGFGLQMILNRVYFAKQLGLFPLISGVVAIIINFILCKMLVKNYGIMGLSISSSVSVTIAGLILGIGVKKMDSRFLVKNDFKQFLRITVATFFMAIIVILIRNSLINILSNNLSNNIILLAIPTIVGFIVYMGLSYIMGIEEIKILILYLKRK